MVIEITKAEYVRDYSIRLSFSNGKKKTIDFKKFIESSSNPMTLQFKDKKKFSAFKIEYGDLVWGNYDLCFPIWDLHQGKI